MFSWSWIEVRTLAYQISFEVFDEYIKFFLIADNLYAGIGNIIMTIEKLAEENNRTKILIDATDVTPPTQMERFHMGEYAASVDQHRNTIALFTKPEIINKFFENVAVNRGVNINVSGSEKEALDWLLSDVPQTRCKPVSAGGHKGSGGPKT